MLSYRSSLKVCRRNLNALSEAEVQRQADAQRIAELQRQFEAQRKELEQKKAKPKLPPMSDNDFIELCKSGDAEKVEEAILNGANVNAKDDDGWTALMWAALGGHTETAEVLS